MSKIEIPLENSHLKTVIDSEDADLACSIIWRIDRAGYVIRKGRTIAERFLHRLIKGAPDLGHKVVVDHKDGDKLNNRKENLRICLQAENSRNARKCTRKTHSQFKGVSKDKRNRWRAAVLFKRERFELGFYLDEVLAAKAYDAAAAFLFGEFARPNFPNPIPQDPAQLRKAAAKRNNVAQRGRYSGGCGSRSGKFRAQINIGYKQIYLGSFPSFEEARAARIQAEQLIAETGTVAGVPIEHIRRAAGHERVETTMGYIKT